MFEREKMRFIFNTENLLVDVALRICDKEGSLINSTILSGEKVLTYIELDCIRNEYYLSLESTENFKGQLVGNAIELKYLDVKEIAYNNILNSAKNKVRADEEKINFLDWAVSGDVLDFGYAYQTILEKVEDCVQEIYFKFVSLPMTNGTIIKAVSQGKGDEICIYEGRQYFKRTPRLKEIELHYKKKKKYNTIRWLIATLAMLSAYGLLFYFVRPSALIWIICIFIGVILMGYFYLSNDAIESGYQIMKEKDIITTDDLKKLEIEASGKEVKFDYENDI